MRSPSLVIGSVVLLAVPLAGCGGGGGDATGPQNIDARVFSMSRARAEHAATSLANDDVLLSGGKSTSGPTATCDVFDATLASTSSAVVPTGSMTVARSRHTATLLLSGNVVAIGGAASGATEEYAPNPADPSSAVWTASVAAVLATPRSRHTATRLADGRVLVTGGVDGVGSALASCEIYVNSASPMAAAAPMSVPRRDHAAILLPDGRVLVAGGADTAGTPLASAEAYDPILDTWSPVGALAAARALHAFTLLNATDGDPANDRVLATGGADASGEGLVSTELFDPGANSFSAGGDIEMPGVFAHAAVLLANGQVAVAGGFTAGGLAAPDGPVKETVVYRFGSGGGVGAQDLPGRRGALAAAAIPSTGPAGSSLVVSGGFDANGDPRPEVWLLAIDDEATALADSLADDEALALGVFATAFHILDDGLEGSGDADLSVEFDPVLGRVVTGFVGDFEVFLEFDAGSVVGWVEGKPYALTVTAGYVDSPDMQVDFRLPDRVPGDFDADFQNFDFDVDRTPTVYRGWILGPDAEAALRVEISGSSTVASDSWLDVWQYWAYDPLGWWW